MGAIENISCDTIHVALLRIVEQNHSEMISSAGVRIIIKIMQPKKTG